MRNYRNQHYLDFIKDKPCLKCGTIKTDYIDIVPAHQKLGHGGMGIKSPDIFALPLCMFCHATEHLIGHKLFWEGENRELRCLEYINEYMATNKGRKI